MIKNNLDPTTKELKSQTVKSPENKPSKRIKVSRSEVIRDAHCTKKDDRTTERTEDYLEVIYELVQHKGYAASIDIAECLNVRQPSVTKMMRRLAQSKLVDYEKYRGIRLTEKGIEIARAIHERHIILSEFLRMIGVDENIASRDAEEIEHHVHPDTLRKLRQLLQHMKDDLGAPKG
jgi:DtxR family manganese transport transcriptional regulator